jgi:hypothetical protein
VVNAGCKLVQIFSIDDERTGEKRFVLTLAFETQDAVAGKEMIRVKYPQNIKAFI